MNLRKSAFGSAPAPVLTLVMAIVLVPLGVLFGLIHLVFAIFIQLIVTLVGALVLLESLFWARDSTHDGCAPDRGRAGHPTSMEEKARKAAFMGEFMAGEPPRASARPISN
jgi:hypothetical protein